MLDVYQVSGIVKQAQAEFRQKFEEEHSDIVEFISKKIIESAKLGDVETEISFEDLMREKLFDGKQDFNDKSLLEAISLLKNIKKYLEFKGFYVDKAYKDYMGKYVVDDFAIKIKWPKG